MILVSSTMLVGPLLHVTTAVAAPSSSVVVTAFQIGPQPLSNALTAFGMQSGWQLSVPNNLVAKVRSPGVRGTVSPETALTALLAGTGLTWQITGPRSATVRKAYSAITLGPVRVEGTGAPHSTDAAATDLTRSYAAHAASVAGKLPLDLRHVPQSVSVVTRQRMDDQNLTSMEDALRQTTGVTAISYDQAAAYYQVRGFPAEIQYDGLPASTGASYSNQFDLAIYDRIEVLKGPAGLQQGSGEPAGTINLARKRPHDKFDWGASFMGGSWNNFHGDLDVTGPLNSARTLRGRFVAAGQDRDFFVDREHERHGLLYAILEYDLDRHTTLTISGTYEYQKNSPFDYGQSVYSNGQFLNAPRSSFFGLNWSKLPVRSGEIYASLDHDMGSEWKVRASFNCRQSTTHGLYGYLNDYVNLDNSADYYEVRYQYNGSRQALADVNIGGPFSLFKRQHKIVIGANYSWYDFINQLNATSVSVANIYNIEIPQQIPPMLFRTDTRTELVGTYAEAMFHIIDPLMIVGGGRFSFYNSKTRDGVPFGSFSKDPSINGHFTPMVGIVYDINKNWNFYGSYERTFVPQTDQTYGGGTLPPRKGEQFEVGIKGSLLNNMLNTSLAAFNIIDRNRAYVDPDHPDYYLAAGKVRSRGIEMEISGEPLPGWSVFGGYTYLETKYLDDDTYQGRTFDNEEPHHTLKIWTTYRIGSINQPGFQVGGGIRVMSKTSRGGPTQPTYAVFDTQIGYRLNKKWSATLNVTNLFDKKYYVRVPSEYFGIYGDPRAFTVSLRKSF
ncbi:MAG: TonB-dependent siderophore receptor [Gluconacetobacter sp.]